MQEEFLIGQAIVTDPAVSGTGGYMLVAASPFVSAEDCEHLAANPQISEYLHIEPSPRVFFSFYALPSGAWAFAQRFARGTRRGSLNRIVAHTLVLSEESLEALVWEPRLLANCSFRVGGEVQSFASIKDWPGGQVPRALQDLVLIPPQDPDGQRLELLASRRKYLSDLWTQEELANTLAQALAGWKEGQGLLLDQTSEHEQLLALAWSALPRRDRRETAWTTHLAPGSAGLFRLANFPGMDARAAGASGWLTLGRNGNLGSRAVAQALVLDHPHWREVASRWYESPGPNGLSLVDNGAQVSRWLRWLEHGGAPEEGFHTLPDLTSYLDTGWVDSSAVEDPWERKDELLRLSAATLRNLTRGKLSFNQVTDPILKALEVRDLARVLLTPERFIELTGRGTELDEETFLAALELVLRHAGGHPARQAQLLKSALAAALNRRDPRLAGRIAAEYVVTQAGALDHFADAEVEDVLEALRAAPGGLVEALRSWPEERYDRALQALGRWTQEEPQAAVTALAHLAALEDVGLRERPSLEGLTARLANAGAPPEHWFPVALAEAMVTDREGSAPRVKSFVAFLASQRASIAAAKMKPSIRRLFHHLRRGDLAFSTAHRELVVAFAPAMALWPADALAAMSQVQLTAPELRAGWPAFEKVAEALDHQGCRTEASGVRRTWWTYLAGLPWEGMDIQALALFDALSDADRKEVAGSWVAKLAHIPRRPGDETLVSELRRRIADDPKHQLELEIHEIRARIPQITLAKAVAEIAEKLKFSTGGEQRLGDIVEEELRKYREYKLTELLKLLLSPELLPSTRRLIEERLFLSRLRSADERLFFPVWDVSVEALARRGSLLLKVARRLGEVERNVVGDGYQFLEEVVRLNHFDAAASFLHGATRYPKFFDRLRAAKKPQLVRQLKEAARDRVHGWDLRLFLQDLESLPVE